MFWRKKRNPADFAEEIRAHLQLESDELAAEGVANPTHAARRAFGNVTSVQERSYERGLVRWLDELWHDLRYASRTLRRSPAFTRCLQLFVPVGRDRLAGLGCPAGVCSRLLALCGRRGAVARDLGRVDAGPRGVRFLDGRQRAGCGGLRADRLRATAAEHRQRQKTGIRHQSTARRAPTASEVIGHGEASRFETHARGASQLPCRPRSRLNEPFAPGKMAELRAFRLAAGPP